MNRQHHLSVLRSDGFTLIEALVALAVTSLLILLIGNFMVNNILESTLTTDQAMLLSQSELALDFVANDLRSGAGVLQNNTASDANAPTMGMPYSWQSNNTRLVVATAAHDTSGNDIFSDPSYVADSNYTTENNNFVYFVSGGTLYKRILAYTPTDSNDVAVTTCPTAGGGCPVDKQLLNNVTTFTITYLDKTGNDITSTMPGSASSVNAVELHVIASETVYNHSVTADYTTRMVLRNG